jgi:hypothetical protein
MAETTLTRKKVEIENKHINLNHNQPIIKLDKLMVLLRHPLFACNITITPSAFYRIDLPSLEEMLCRSFN